MGKIPFNFSTPKFHSSKYLGRPWVNTNSYSPDWISILLISTNWCVLCIALTYC